MVTTKEKSNCPYIYRKAGSNAVHCKVQEGRGVKWDYCKYQYFCRKSNRYEATAETNTCVLRGE